MPKLPPGCVRCASRSRRRVGSGRSVAAPSSIEARPRRTAGPPALRPARDQLTGLVMADMPGAVLAHEQIAGDQRAAAELLFADDESGVAVEEHPLVITDDARRLGVRQDAAPAVDGRLPAGERRPPPMHPANRPRLSPYALPYPQTPPLHTAA